MKYKFDHDNRTRSDIWQNLQAGEVVDFEGLKLVKINEPLEPGDLYVAERNTGPKLLTVKEVVYDSGPPNHFGNWVNPTTIDYPFDIWECIKVKEVN